MGVKAIPLEVFIAYLEQLGLVATGGKGSHTKYNYPKNHSNGQLSRPVIVRMNYKDIPIDHIATNLQTLGISKKEFEDWFINFRNKKY